MADDASTVLLRSFLKDRGFAPHRWQQGRNLGPQRGVREGMVRRLDELYQRYDRKVSIVGWSLACRVLGLTDSDRFTAHFRGELDSESVIEESWQAIRAARQQG